MFLIFYCEIFRLLSVIYGRYFITVLFKIYKAIKLRPTVVCPLFDRCLAINAQKMKIVPFHLRREK